MRFRFIGIRCSLFLGNELGWTCPGARKRKISSFPLARQVTAIGCSAHLPNAMFDPLNAGAVEAQSSSHGNFVYAHEIVHMFSN